MTWFLRDFGRLDMERRQFEAMREMSPWMSPPVWRWATGALEVDLDIKIDGQNYPLRLRYPYAFPACPPSVYPRDQKVRWSNHQYGPGGELCLEIGPDNWVPEVTGAQMIESAYRLLEAERPLSAKRPVVELPSRHQLTPGQSLRSTHNRFLITENLINHLSSVEGGTVKAMIVIQIGHGKNYTFVVSSLQNSDGTWWKDSSFPVLALAENRYKWSGYAACSNETTNLPLINSTDILIEQIKKFEIPTSRDQLSNTGHEFFLFFGGGREPVLVWALSPSIGALSLESLRAEHSFARRLEPGYEKLASRRVGIVGAGSVGSKVASSLARAGVGGILLFDGDILLPGNLVRHDLDWTSVGGHKVDELAWRLAVIRPGIDVTVWRTLLTGQEASASVAAALDALASCDLIVDATADGEIFGLVGSHAAAHRRPMIWAEVLEGGIGGLVARARPGEEPAPLVTRSRILNWCVTMNAPWGRSGDGYASVGDNDSLLVADDADVTVIAAHCARLTIDTLLERMPSDFPHSVYFIGLRRSWIFSEPFDTHPVDVGTPDDSEAADSVPKEVVKENIAFLQSLLPESTDAPDSSA